MIREKLLDRERHVVKGFRWRGVGEVSRIEALSDGVIAFAVTLLVVSLEVPRTFDQLLVTMRGFVAFAITFFMLFHVWFVQYKFFRRYGLNDNFTIWTNAFLLFVVLFYVYPLKFVWTLTVNMMMGLPVGRLAPDGTIEPPIRREQVPQMMAIFGLGFAAVFTVFTLLYHHAYRKRVELELNELEIHDTRTRCRTTPATSSSACSPSSSPTSRGADWPGLSTGSSAPSNSSTAGSWVNAASGSKHAWPPRRVTAIAASKPRAPRVSID
ncbi:MAG TPA: TMEM175 family protein [Pyrinomonadaceae bacterium]|jgi:hypothetical protein